LPLFFAGYNNLADVLGWLICHGRYRIGGFASRFLVRQDQEHVKVLRIGYHGDGLVVVAAVRRLPIDA
jgi:hypothetical protein